MILNSVSSIFKKNEISPLFRDLDLKSNISLEGITSSSFSLIISSAFEHLGGQILVITKNSQAMQEMYFDLSSFLDNDKIVMLPPWETLPYEFVSPSERVERDRVSAIYKILEDNPCVIITTVEALIRRIPEKEY